MSVPRVVVFVCLVSVLLAAAVWASAGPVNDQIAAAVVLPDGAGVVLDAVYVESVIGGSASVRDTWAHSQSLLVFTDAAVQANWTVKVTGQMTTIDGQRVLIASAVQLYATIDGSPAPPLPACMLAAMAGVSLVDIPPMPAQRGIGVPMNILESTEVFDGSIGSAKRVGGTVTLAGKVVTAVFHDGNGLVSFFYIQEPGGSGNLGVYGIRVKPNFTVPVEVGDVLTVHGNIVPALDGSDVAECYLNAGYDLLEGGTDDSRHVVCTGSQLPPRPLGLRQKLAANGEFGLQRALYRGTGDGDIHGFAIVGTLVRIWGKVTFSADDHVCWIDDGSRLKSILNDGPNNPVEYTGIRIIYEAATPHLSGDMVAGVTGILGAEMDDAGNPVPVLRVPKPEAVPTHIIRVKTVAGGTHCGDSWDNASTLSDALDNAVPGDEIWVAAGTYYGQFTMANGVGLYGGFAGVTETARRQRDWVANKTILDGQDGGVVISVTDCSDPATRISGFEICNGMCGDPPLWSPGSPAGGGIRCTDSFITIRDNLIGGNKDGCGWGIGSGAYCEYSTALIWNNTFGTGLAPNEACEGAAVCIAYCTAQSALLDNVIDHNHYELDVNDYTYELCGSTVWWQTTAGSIAFNVVSNNAGGMYLFGAASAPVDICGNAIVNNGAWPICADNAPLAIRNNRIAGYAGGAAVTAESGLMGISVTDNLIEDSGRGLRLRQEGYSPDPPHYGQATISGNTIRNNRGGFSGAGMRCIGGDYIIKHNTIEGNCTSHRGGGLTFAGDLGRDDEYQNDLPPHKAIVEGNTFRYNTSGVRGAALQAYRVPDLTIQNNLFVGNQCSGSDDTGGGAIAVEWSSSVIINNTFVQNWVGTLDGNGPFPAAGEDIWANVIPAAYGGAILICGIWSYAPPAVVLNNIFYDNMADQGKAVACIVGGQAGVSYSDAAPSHSQAWFYYWDSGDESCSLSVDTSSCHYVDPAFAVGGYSLSPSSLLVTLYHGSSSSPAPATDILGYPRPQGGYTEMGAYESTGSP